MKKRSGFWSAFVLAVAMGAPVLAQQETSDTVVATVNGSKITLGQMIALRETLPQQYQQLPDDVLFKGIYEQLIQQELLAQSVKDLSPRALATIDNDKRGLISGIAIEAIAKQAVTEEALQAAYDARFKDAKPQTEYNAAHILVATQEEADKLKAELAAGADFAELAKANSTDTGSGANGGDLGWFGLGTMVKPFEDAVVAAKVGEVTGPVKSEFGYHLILVKETRIADKPTLEQLRAELAAEIEKKAINAQLEELTKGATVTRDGEGLDPALLKNATLID
ncbi:peptidylprolyl isomerase [Tabrizicola sp.]|uniref:peptidylprolyl isomerase n=1 Tax=Tabrizicola sp. TaxID=2005166 RepID=UPI000BDA556E|nr:peptidylprolyl isomerase [Tabrizicola sp.]MBY0350000.1 peptidylprolyl isomerase [Tabrizicola sp.]MDK2774277.1 peptidylprolyl isomerase [Tabrizicola sp.]OYX20167.1 MAG: peptidylprolyl isomerase [Rhodobacterales bacterium 32-66-9]